MASIEIALVWDIAMCSYGTYVRYPLLLYGKIEFLNILEINLTMPHGNS